MSTDRREAETRDRDDATQLVTVFVGSQMFGLSILQVRDVFLVNGVTPVPLAPSAVAGLYNLRGRVMTMLSMRSMLGLGANEATGAETTAVGIEWRGESYGLLIDKVGEVVLLPASGREPNPTNLDRRWSRLSAGVHRLDSQLLVELDLEALIQDAIRDNHPGVIAAAA